MLNPPLTLGIEEEYQIIDPESRQLSGYVAKILERGRMVLGDQIKNEFMLSQVEVGSKICKDLHEAREEVIHLRRTVAELAAEDGRVIAAAATHPFARWQEQEFTPGERYDDLRSSMQDAARRLLIFGLHVHIGIGKDSVSRELTIDLLNQVRYFLPHILALSTSSPFWHGRPTGMKSYRSLVFENMPRSGISPIFNSYSDYHRYVNLMYKVGALGSRGTEKASFKEGDEIIDATKIWWDARPHPIWGTLEIRVADMCTTLEETLAIAGLIQALVAKLVKLRNNNRTWRIYPNYLIEENKWRAVRYGIEGKLIDFGREEEAPMPQLVEEILDVVDDVLDELDIRQEVEFIRTICQKGTSADRQIATYHRLLDEGKNNIQALQGVVDQLIEETHRGWQA
jgi:carboxylate-amine ligase